ncbi:MAG: hypothetical protein DRJ65_16765 [Acidobacteria bacterium]|nr:MAG: hypothetical protein DRJ65_16765 [Acidobacteriota bacterium]
MGMSPNATRTHHDPQSPSDVRPFFRVDLWRGQPQKSGAAFATVLILSALVMPQPALCQEWSGTVDLAYGWMDTTGNPDAFRTQYNLDSGFSLDQLDLDFRGEGSLEHFSLEAWGWGDAEPAESFRLGLDFAPGLQVELDYRSNQSFFGLAGSDLAGRTDQWNLSRWRGSVVWTGWEDWTLGAEYRYVDRDGRIYRPHYGLNELYPLGVNLDETMSEFGIRVENRSTPVRLVFEQTWAQYERKNRPFAAGDQALSNPDDPDFFVSAGSTAEDEQDVPTSSLTASWGTDRWEGVATLLYSNADLQSGADPEGTATIWETYDIGGGAIGTTSWVDELVSSTQMDSLVGALRLGFRMGQSWTLRLGGSYRDASADSSLLGRRLLHTVNPAGQVFEIEAPVDENGYYNFTDSDVRLTLDWNSGAWSVWGGAFMAGRDVAWRLTTDGSPFAVKRDSDGFLGGIAWSSNGGIDASLEYETGAFERYIFRTDPENVDRLTARLRARLGGGWNLNFHGRCEQTDNPDEVAALDRDSAAHGLGFGWTSSQGEHSFGLNLDQVSLESATDLILPDGGPGVSIYDLDLLTGTIFGHSDLGRVHLQASATYTSDSGDTWPVDAWNAVGRIGYDLSDTTRIGAFIQYWDYDEQLADADDFTATRYGLSLRWSFTR